MPCSSNLCYTFWLELPSTMIKNQNESSWFYGSILITAYNFGSEYGQKLNNDRYKKYQVWLKLDFTINPLF